MQIAIVPTAEQHFAGLHAALDEVAREKRFLAFVAAPPRDEAYAFYRRIVQNDLCQFVALVDDGVVGWCDILAPITESRAHAGVLGIGLVARARHRGIGARLMQAAIDKAWAQGLTRIELSVRAGNVHAQALYHRFGFQLEGVQKNAYRVDGRYEDGLMMALLRPLGAGPA